jgi:hypothetical protein
VKTGSWVRWLGLLALAALAAGLANAAPASAQAQASSSGWHVRTVLKLTTQDFNEAIDPAANAAYLAVGETGGPFTLERVNLTTHAVKRGAKLPVAGILPAAGYIWVYGTVVSPSSAAQIVLYQVSTSTLKTVRSFRLTPKSTASNRPLAITAGPQASVWLGYLRTVQRIDAKTGKTLAKFQLPAGLQAGSVAVDPSGTHLYVAAAAQSGSHAGETRVSEYAASNGRHLFTAAHLLPSLVSAALTAVPSGAWASYHTGLLGSTVFLRQRGLAEVVPASSFFTWAMNATTLYGGGSLWLGEVTGRIGCVAPSTGRVLARTTLSQLAASGKLFAVNAGKRLVYGLGETPTGSAIISISTPRACWS